MLCITLMPETTDAALDGLALAARHGCWAELRLDAMREFELQRLLTKPPCRTIVTYRPRREGGLYDGPEDARLAVLRQAAGLGDCFIDIEHDAIDRLADVPRRRTIISYHNFDRTPPDLADIHTRLARSGAAVVKIAAMANHILDAAAMLRLLKGARTPTIALSMGPRGLITRLLAGKFGGFLTYASPAAGFEPAPGQVSLEEMLQLYRVDRIGPQTHLYGVLADPVGHSLSPRIHNAAFAELGLDAVYLPLWVEGDPAAFVRAMREFAFDGYSVTIPHKQTVMAALDEIEPLALSLGAVNTVKRRQDGSLFGTNTDWTAGLAAIEAVVGDGWLSGKRALVIGAGGVGRAMTFALKQRLAQVTLTDIDPARAESLARDTGAQAVPIADTRSPSALAVAACDLLLNCSPIGMHPKVDDSPVPAAALRRGLVVYDAVYNPLETRLIRDARRAGCKTIAGVDHFVRQAVEQFEFWTGRPAPIEVMRRVVVEALSS